MRKSKFSEGQITMALRQAEAGTPVSEICRKLGISQSTFFRWKKMYGGLGVPEVRELRQLRDENRRLKQLVADLSLDRSILQEALRNRPALHALQRLPPAPLFGDREEQPSHPAMAAGIADRPWKIQELLALLPKTKPRGGRPTKTN